MNKRNNVQSDSKSRYDPRYEAGDTYVGSVPVSDTKVILVYLRKYSNRTWVRFRVWNLQRQKLVWYPTNRYFVTTLTATKELGSMIYHAADMEPEVKPDWLQAHELGVAQQLWALRALGVPDEDIEAHQRDIEGYPFEESLVPLLLEDELASSRR